METKTFMLTARGKTIGSITASADKIVGAEQNIVLLDAEGKPIAIVELQPGVDRRQTRL